MWVILNSLLCGLHCKELQVVRTGCTQFQWFFSELWRLKWDLMIEGQVALLQGDLSFEMSCWVRYCCWIIFSWLMCVSVYHIVICIHISFFSVHFTYDCIQFTSEFLLVQICNICSRIIDLGHRSAIWFSSMKAQIHVGAVIVLLTKFQYIKMFTIVVFWIGKKIWRVTGK